jgi:hypothetical protein
MSEMMALGAASLQKSHEKSTEKQIIDTLFLRALSRVPTPAEYAAAETLLGSPVTQEGLEDLLWAVCMLPEFQLNQ